VVKEKEERIMKIRLSLTIPKWVDGIFAGLILKYRRYRYGQPFRRVLLTGGRYALVDQKDFYRVNDLDWIVKEDYDSIYAVHFLKIPENSSKLISMHRFILNPPEGIFVDHRNCNGLDNRRDNLRPATRGQNNCNRRKRKGCSSKYKGVYFHKSRKGRKKWDAYINVNGKRIFLGTYQTQEEAAMAYDAAAKKYYGQFARLNFPRKDYINDFPPAHQK
jgi:hypothetical protein